MTSRRLQLIFVPLLFATLIVPSLLPPARAAGITVKVNQNSVSITMNLELFDNLTTSLPLIDVVLDQSSPIVQPIQSGFQAASPGTHIDQFSLHVRTVEINNATGLWVLQENYTMTVSGVNDNTGGRILSDLAFLSSKNNQSITYNSVELNHVGQAYMVQGIQRFPPDSKTRYYAGTGGFTLPLVPEQYAQTFNMLDLSWIAPVQDWVGNYVPFQSSTVWNFQPRTMPFNVTVGTGLTSEQTYLKRYQTYLNSSGQIVAPARSEAVGSTVIFNIPTPADILMPIIMVASLAILIVAFVVERRIAKPIRISKSRRR